jgi:hypothetical protein
MLKQSLVAGAVAAALSLSAQADYQFQVAGAYATGELTAGNGVDADQDLFTLGGTYFFAPVDDSKGPRSEDAFIDRASGVSLFYTFGEVDFDNGGDSDIENIVIDGRYVIKDSGWLVGLGYQFDDGDGGPDSDAYAIEVGKYIGETTTLVASWVFGEDDDNRESDEYALSLEHLQDLGESALKLEAGLGLVDSNFASDVNLYSVGATYYITDYIGVGGSYSFADSDDGELDQYTLFGEYWVNDRIGLSLGLTAVDEDNSSAESDAVIFAVTGRF